jgi:hypothetical protein
LSATRDRVNPGPIRSKRAGERVVEPIRTQPWGLRDFRIVDPDGYYLRVTTKE